VRALSRSLVRGDREVFRVELPDDAPPREASPLPALRRPSPAGRGWDVAAVGLFERGPVAEVETPGRARLACLNGGLVAVALVVDLRRFGRRRAEALRDAARAAGATLEELDARCTVERWTLTVGRGALVSVGGSFAGLFRAERGGCGVCGVPWLYTCGPSPSWGVVVDGEPLVRVDGVPPSWPPARAEGAARDGLGATL